MGWASCRPRRSSATEGAASLRYAEAPERNP